MNSKYLKAGWEENLLRRTFPELSATQAEALVYDIRWRQTTYPNTSKANPYHAQFVAFLEANKGLSLEELIQKAKIKQ